MIKVFPFGAFSGFSDQSIAGCHYYSQNLVPSLLGVGTLYSLVNKCNSGVNTMGNILHFALGPGGALFADDDQGNILKETTPGAGDFAIVHTMPSSNGAGLVGDQFSLKRLFFASPAYLGMFDGTTWNDTTTWNTSPQAFSCAVAHPMCTYEDLILFGDGNNVAALFSNNSYNASVFSLPAGMVITAIKGGPTGILIGANLGYKGYIILWDGNSLRAKTPWKETKGQILDIETYGESWIVKTQREVLLTNGYTVKQLLTVFDDPLAVQKSYEAGAFPQQMTVVNDTLIFANQKLNSGKSYEFGKMKPGLYLYHMSRHAWSYLPAPTGNTIDINVTAVYADAGYSNRILVAYSDNNLGVKYIAQLVATPPTSAQYVSEAVGIGRPHYQRTYFGPTEKVAEAIILNLGILNSITDPAAETFNVSVKLYDFKRQLWGYQLTNTQLSNYNQVRVDGTVLTKAQVGDEVTVLEGVNAGLIAHITAIANGGTSTETWTLDTAFPSATEDSIYLQVQPFKLVEKKTFTALSELKHLYFSVKDSTRAKQFLIKVVLDGIGANLQLEMQVSYFVFDDLSYDAT